jgi:hypothetical protein
MAYTIDLKSIALRHTGSSPVTVIEWKIIMTTLTDTQIDSISDILIFNWKLNHMDNHCVSPVMITNAIIQHVSNKRTERVYAKQYDYIYEKVMDKYFRNN